MHRLLERFLPGLKQDHGKIPHHTVLEEFCRQTRKANFLLREYTLMVFDQSNK